MKETNTQVVFKHRDIINRSATVGEQLHQNSNLTMHNLGQVESVKLGDLSLAAQVDSEAREMVSVCKEATKYAKKPKPEKNKKGFLKIAGECVSEFNSKGGVINWVKLSDTECCAKADFHGKIKTLKYTVDRIYKMRLSESPIFINSPVTFMRGVCFCATIDLVAPRFCEKMNEFLLTLKTGN